MSRCVELAPPLNSDLRCYTTIDVARRLGVSLQTVQRWVDAGHLKAWKTPGGHRRIEASSAEQLFREQQDRLSAPQGPSAGDSAASTDLSVVVVEDDPGDRALLVALVRKALPHAKIEAAANGFEGLMVIGKSAPRIVITDIHMPHMDGFEMIRTLLKDVPIPARTLIAVSGYSKEELSAMGSLPPDVKLFTKPIEQNRFLSALREESWPPMPMDLLDARPET